MKFRNPVVVTVMIGLWYSLPAVVPTMELTTGTNSVISVEQESRINQQSISANGNPQDTSVLQSNRRRPSTCSYDPFLWHAEQARSVPLTRVEHSYESLAPDEIHHATGCTVCEEDQATIHLPPLAPFRICHSLADQVQSVLARLLAVGEPIFEVNGYRVGRTRGELNSSGFRPEFSSHAYGIAIDVNPDQNGFYHSCMEFGPWCRLMQGGTWIPGQPGTLTATSAIVKELQAVGFLWGGEILGTQKDFMHFSPTGY